MCNFFSKIRDTKGTKTIVQVKSNEKRRTYIFQNTVAEAKILPPGCRGLRIYGNFPINPIQTGVNKFKPPRKICLEEKIWGAAGAPHFLHLISSY